MNHINSVSRKVFLKGLTAFAGLTATGYALSACTKPDTKAPSGAGVINFSILSVEKSQDLQELWTPLLDDMAQQTGLTVKPFYASDYTALIEAMRFNQVQAGWFSNVPGLEAVNRAEGEVFAETEYPVGFEGYKSIVIVNKDSKLTIDDVLKCNKSLTFGMGDAKSTSGTQAPLFYLFLPKHVDPDNCFKQVVSGNHQTNIQGVAHNLLDAATNNSTALVELKARQPETFAKVKVIWESPNLPNDVIIYRKDLDPAIKEKLRSFFLAYGRGTGAEAERQKKVLNGLIMGGFKPSDNNHFIPIRMMQASTDLMQAHQANDAAAAAKAEAEIKKIQAEKAALDAKAPS
jgi:phosphonate transport system substrate-binding protein